MVVSFCELAPRVTLTLEEREKHIVIGRRVRRHGKLLADLTRAKSILDGEGQRVGARAGVRMLRLGSLCLRAIAEIPVIAELTLRGLRIKGTLRRHVEARSEEHMFELQSHSFISYA